MSDTHAWSLAVKRLSQLFRTPAFPAHITLRSRLRYNPVECPSLQGYERLDAFPHKIHASSTMIRSWDYTQFHAIEMPVSDHFHLPRNAHVSLAYRVGGRPFNQEEVATATEVVRSIPGWEFIQGTELSAVIYDATSEQVERWHQA